MECLVLVYDAGCINYDELGIRSKCETDVVWGKTIPVSEKTQHVCDKIQKALDPFYYFLNLKLLYLLPACNVKPYTCSRK